MRARALIGVPVRPGRRLWLWIRVLPIFLPVLGATLACRPDPCEDTTGPFRGLLCETSSAVFDQAYWRTEAGADSSIWRKALAFCRERAFPRGTRCSLLARVDQELTARREAEAARRRLEENLRSLGEPGGFSGLPPAREPAPGEPPTLESDPS